MPTTDGDNKKKQLRQWELVQQLRQDYEGLWESLSQAQRDRIIKLAADAGGDPKAGYWDFRKQVSGLKFFKAWQKGEDPTNEPPDPDEDPDPDPDPDEDPTAPPPPEEPAINQSILEVLRAFLEDNQLPLSLLGFIQEGLAAKKPQAQILAELRQTEEYKAAYPENEVRQMNGLSWMPEAQIREMRDEIKRLSMEYMGVGNVSQEELTNVIGSGWSLRTFEVKLQRLQELERWGPSVRGVLESELGHPISDDRLFAFFDDTPTPELDRAYERALLRGQPALLGLGIRPEEEAELLRRYGIAPEQAFRGYQELARELPAQERLGLIEAEIERNIERFPDGTQLFNDTPFALLFRGIQLQDGEALRELQARLARETARWQGSGGAVQDRAGASIGLLTEEERQQL